jgi:hypothetical protein
VWDSSSIFSDRVLIYFAVSIQGLAPESKNRRSLPKTLPCFGAYVGIRHFSGKTSENLFGVANLLRSMSENASHEKAGRSQVRSFVSWLDMVVLFSRDGPLSLPFHPHSSRAIVCARCKLGVLVTAGAASCFSTSVPSTDGSWARHLTQSPKLGVFDF